MQHAPGESAAAERDALLEAASDAVIFIDTRGQIEVFNRAAERLFGYAEGEVLGRNVSMLIADEDAGAHDAQIKRHLDDRALRPTGTAREVEARRKDGSIFPARVSVARIKQSDPPRFVGIIHDITLRRQAATERSTYEKTAERSHLLQERLTRVARLASMGEMAAGIAHELNQPLTAIASYAQACDWMLARGSTDIDEIRDALRQIASQGLRAGEIIRRLRGMVRKQEAEPIPTDANELVEEIKTLAVIDARVQGVQLSFNLASDLPAVLADRVRIQQVLINLVRNSFEALQDIAPDARSVVLDTGRHVDGDVAIRVSDSGPGVDPKILDRLFDPFLTTRPTGSGLGLAVSRSIVEAHRGTLRYEPPAAGGASFVLTLPSVSTSALTSAQGPSR